MSKQGKILIVDDDKSVLRSLEIFLDVEFDKVNTISNPNLILGELQSNKYDVVLLFGVLYHLKYPLKAIEIMSKITNKILILESHYINTKDNNPVMEFYPEKELNNDPTNWWGPNIKCIVEMLKVAEFKKVEVFMTYWDKRVIIKAYK